MNHIAYIGSNVIEPGTQSDLFEAVRSALGRSPTVTGTRLRSERELAVVLNVSRKRVRIVLDDLVNQGVLVRRHGSGTYVRRVPERTVDEDGLNLRTTSPKWFISTESIIASDDGRSAESQRLKPAEHQGRLRLEIWSGFHKTTSTNRTILNAMLDRAEQMGHDLSVHSLIRQADQPLHEEELVKRLRAQPGDGYLVSAALGPLFRRAFDEAFASTQPPAVYVAPGSAQVDFEPMIRIDTDEAVTRAVRLLRAEGYERVGMIGAISSQRPGPTEAAIYNWAAECAGQAYRGVAEMPRNADGGHAGASALLGRDLRPDALYVANDELLPGVVAALAQRGLRPGRDIGLITLSTTANVLPIDYRWSQLQFDPELVGHQAVDALLNLIQTAGGRLGSQSYLAKWLPGETHRRP